MYFCELTFCLLLSFFSYTRIQVKWLINENEKRLALLNTNISNGVSIITGKEKPLSTISM